MRYPISDQ